MEILQNELDALARAENLAPVLIKDAIGRLLFSGLTGAASGNLAALGRQNVTLGENGALLLNLAAQVTLSTVQTKAMHGEVSAE